MNSYPGTKVAPIHNQMVRLTAHKFQGHGHFRPENRDGSTRDRCDALGGNLIRFGWSPGVFAKRPEVAEMELNPNNSSLAAKEG
jgi:hypothetical protein